MIAIGLITFAWLMAGVAIETAKNNQNAEATLVALIWLDERSVQKLGCLAINKVRAFYIPAQKTFRIGLGRAFDDGVEL
jgi:hypothetical protein